MDYSNCEGKKLVVLGGGESGVGAAVLGKVKGFRVWLSDMGSISDKYTAMLEEHGIDYEQNGHTAEKILDADVIVKSPGIPDSAPLVAEACRKGIPVVSEIEFAGKFTDSKMVCITGSNGKTTTTMLTYHIFRKAGIDVGLAGNVGKSLALQVALDPHEVYIIELSSFQLDNMYDFKANVAVILNITPDHLDRYDYKMENYTAAKFRILQNQTKDDYFIYWLDDPIIREQICHVQSEALQLPFSESYEKGDAAWVEDGIVRFDIHRDSWDLPLEELSLPGVHNLYNSMAAGLSAGVMNLRKEDIRAALADFEAVEHRLEFVAETDGIRWINDSKATNVNSTFYALGSMTSPTVLILGGKDKGNDYSEILPLVEQKVKAIVAMGKDNSKILSFFEGKVEELRDTHSIEEAVATCRELASEGDTVLLSPCCASFDLFKSYEDRGRQFKEAVKKL
ncbi:MAG: UDP-N-acetylmuramoyl-L-alanine--D-glutamate ligase [Muribaculaceae bacterium]|nr:UDP-N-acetylmuramoyl-L-alanine--D-glutamate ligase [Muribaculaceae bacterium]